MKYNWGGHAVQSVQETLFIPGKIGLSWEMAFLQISMWELLPEIWNSQFAGESWETGAYRQWWGVFWFQVTIH